MKIQVRIQRCVVDRLPAAGLDPSRLQAAVEEELVRLYHAGGQPSDIEITGPDRVGREQASHNPPSLGRQIAAAIDRQIRTGG